MEDVSDQIDKSHLPMIKTCYHKGTNILNSFWRLKKKKATLQYLFLIYFSFFVKLTQIDSMQNPARR